MEYEQNFEEMTLRALSKRMTSHEKPYAARILYNAYYII